MSDTAPFQQRVDKPWGYEVIYTPADLSYVGKILMVKRGKRLSLQYHDQKVETLCLFSGSALVWLEGENGEMEKIPMEPFKGYTMKVGRKHRVEAIEDSFIIESSLPEIGTTVRVEDDFARPDETEEIRRQERQGIGGQSQS